MVIKEITIDNSGIPIYCRQYCGNPFAKETVAMVHGLSTDSGFFDETAKELSRAFRVVVYDRRGYGRTPSPKDDDYSPKAQASDIAAILAASGTPCHLVGHSAGSIITFELAFRQPRMISSIIAFEPPIGDSLPRDSEFRSALVNVRQHMANNGIKGMPSQGMFGTRDDRARSRALEDNQFAASNYKNGTENDATALMPYVPHYKELSRIDVTIGSGDMSRHTMMEAMSKALANRLGCRFAYFPGSHNCPFDLPRDFASMIAGILACK